MLEVGGSMSDRYRETARGGLAATPTGTRMMRELFGDKQADISNKSEYATVLFDELGPI